jgi:chemotaxis protein CheD
MWITTTLGSCVAVCLHDPKARVSGMNHIILPRIMKADDGPGAVADSAVDGLIQAMERTGAHKKRMQAKLFGGAHVLPYPDDGRGIGARNVKAARERLERHAIPIIAERVLGQHGLQLKLQTETGDVYVRDVSDCAHEERNGVKR